MALSILIMTDENLVKIYYDRLMETEQPGPVLASFFSALLSIPVAKTHIIMFSKFSKVYGRLSTLLSILDVYTLENLDTSKNLYPIFSYFLKKRFEQSISADAQDLSSLAKSNQKLLARRAFDFEKIRSPFNE